MHKSVRPTYTIPAGPVAVTLAIRPDGVERFKQRAKVSTNRDFAYAISYDPGQLSRILAGKAIPGARFIAGAVQAFGWHALKDLLEVVPVDERGEAA